MLKEGNKEIHFVLIDDNDIDLFFHDKLIKIQNISTDVLSFSSPEKAIEYFASFKKNTENYPKTVILLDIQMPEMDGFDFLNHFEKMPDAILHKTRVFIVSSSLDHGDLSRSRAHYLIDAILKKPLNTDKLIKALNRHGPSF